MKDQTAHDATLGLLDPSSNFQSYVNPAAIFSAIAETMKKFSLFKRPPEKC